MPSRHHIIRGLRDLVVLDHVTDDCMARSPPQRVRMTWDPKAELSEKGNYVSAGTVAKANQPLQAHAIQQPEAKNQARHSTT